MGVVDGNNIAGGAGGKVAWEATFFISGCCMVIRVMMIEIMSTI